MLQLYRSAGRGVCISLRDVCDTLQLYRSAGMKLAVEYTIKGTKYRFNIDAEEPKVYEELDKMLKEICKKFNGEVERYRVSKITINIILRPMTATATLYTNSSDLGDLNFIAETVLKAVKDGTLKSFGKEEKLIDVSNPCSHTFAEL